MSILKNIINWVWKNKRLLFVFVFSLLTLVFFGFSRNTIDSIWNYGFSYAIYKGQIPYVDFTMVVTPFYNFVMSIGLNVFSDNIVFLIEQSILITIAFYLLYKMFDDKAWLFLAVMCFPIFVAFCPTYNFFLFFLFVIIYYLEINRKSDFLIGLFLGFMVLTKQTVGPFFLLPSIIIYFKDKDKLLKRLYGFCVPCLCFVVYLLITNSFFKFLDLCLFGLFDFAKENSVFFTPWFFLSIVMLFINIYFVIKDRKNILYWYVLVSFSIMLPIFTRYHFYVYTLFFSLIFISFFEINHKFIKKISLLICLITVTVNFLLTGAYNRIERLSGIKNFSFYYTIKGSKDNLLKIDSLYNYYKKQGDVIMLSTDTSFLKVINDDAFTYFTILNEGNYGFNGTNKMIDRIKKINNSYFMINISDYEFSKNDKVYFYEKSQVDYKVVDFIMSYGKFIEEKYGYYIYFVE